MYFVMLHGFVMFLSSFYSCGLSSLQLLAKILVVYYGSVWILSNLKMTAAAA